MDDTNDGEKTFSLFRGDGENCEKCGSYDNVQTFDGSDLCETCRNEWAAMQ